KAGGYIPHRRRDHRRRAALLDTRYRGRNEQPEIGIVVRESAVHFSKWREDVVAESEVQSQPRARAPVILNVSGRLPCAEAGLIESVVTRLGDRETFQKIGGRDARVRA